MGCDVQSKGAELSAALPHGAETGGGYREGEGGGRPEAARGGGNVEEIRQIDGGLGCGWP